MATIVEQMAEEAWKATGIPVVQLKSNFIYGYKSGFDAGAKFGHDAVAPKMDNIDIIAEKYAIEHANHSRSVKFLFKHYVSSNAAREYWHKQLKVEELEYKVRVMWELLNNNRIEVPFKPEGG